ncbi:hypothetical protein OROGR_025284 [Orobanche gracilis]
MKTHVDKIAHDKFGSMALAASFQWLMTQLLSKSFFWTRLSCLTTTSPQSSTAPAVSFDHHCEQVRDSFLQKTDGAKSEWWPFIAHKFTSFFRVFLVGRVVWDSALIRSAVTDEQFTMWRMRFKILTVVFVLYPDERLHQPSVGCTNVYYRSLLDEEVISLGNRGESLGSWSSFHRAKNYVRVLWLGSPPPPPPPPPPPLGSRRGELGDHKRGHPRDNGKGCCPRYHWRLLRGDKERLDNPILAELYGKDDYPIEFLPWLLKKR